MNEYVAGLENIPKVEVAKAVLSPVNLEAEAIDSLQIYSAETRTVLEVLKNGETETEVRAFYEIQTKSIALIMLSRAVLSIAGEKPIDILQKIERALEENREEINQS